MKKILSLLLVCVLVLSVCMPAMAATKVYDYTGDIPEGDVARFYPYTIAQNATRYTPWFVQWARQREVEYVTGVRGGDGNQRIMAIAASTVNPDHVLIGTDTSGVWRSTDGGYNWEVLGNGNNCWAVNDIVWSPVDENVAFCVQSGHRDIDSEVYKNANSKVDGLYKTTDAGKSWKMVLEKNFLSMGCSNGIIQYDTEKNLYALSSEGLYKSADEGENWELLDNSYMTETTGVYSMYLFGGNSKRMLIGVSGGLFYTTTGGLLWKKVMPNEEGIAECTSVDVDPRDENHWIACFTGVKHKVWETFDGGKTWVKMNHHMNKAGTAIPRMAKYIQKPDGSYGIAVVYDRSGAVFMRSDDEAKTWVSAGANLAGRDIAYNYTGSGYACEGLFIDKTRPGLVWYSFADFVYRSTDGGVTWEPRNYGFSAINTKTLAFGSDNRIWFGDVDRGLAHTTKPYVKGEYSPVDRDITSGECSGVGIDPKDPKHGFAFVENVFYEMKDGATWEKREEVTGGHSVVHFHNKDANFIYAGNAYSTDNGVTWNTLENPVHTVSPVNNDVVYSLVNKVIKVSKDRGKTWSDVKSVGTTNDILADNSDENTVWYVTYTGTVNKCTNGEVTTFGKDNGLKTDNGQYVSLYTIDQDPKDKNHLVTGGKDTHSGARSPGIYETFDGGQTWILVPGMGGIGTIVSVTFSPISDEVFIGTCSNGLLIYDYNTFKKWYNGELTEWDKSDEIIIPNMYKDGRIRVKIDSDVIGFDSEPFVENDRTFVPMRKIFEKLGAEISWDDTTQTVTGVKGDVVVKLTIGSNIATVNGESKTLDAVPQLKNSRTMIPLRFVAEALGCKVDWNESNNLVVIKSK